MPLSFLCIVRAASVTTFLSGTSRWAPRCPSTCPLSTRAHVCSSGPLPWADTGPSSVLMRTRVPSQAHGTQNDMDLSWALPWLATSFSRRLSRSCTLRWGQREWKGRLIITVIKQLCSFVVIFVSDGGNYRHLQRVCRGRLRAGAGCALVQKTSEASDPAEFGI